MTNSAKQNTEALFTILPERLNGLSRMAAEAEHVDGGHLIEFRSLKVRSILNRSISKRLPWLAYSINPYRGCEFGCRYCYARYTHEFLAPGPPQARPNAVGPASIDAAMPDETEGAPLGRTDFHDPEAFERVIFLKQHAAWLLEQDLKRIDPEQQIALGTATDPYQPIERRAGITRSFLEVFARKSGYKLDIVTKSTLIERDIGLLCEVGKHNRLVVHITITTPDAELARKLEPRAPRPDLRFETVRRLREAGIVTGILCSPLLPGITDTQLALDDMARRAAAAGASFFAANPLFLKSCSRPTYFAFVREHFPALLKDYEARFAAADFAAPSYSRDLARMVDRACQRYGLGKRFADALPTPNRAGDAKAVQRRPPHRVKAHPQQMLFG